MTGTKPETRDSTSAAEPGEVDEPRENAIELRKYGASQLEQEKEKSNHVSMVNSKQ